MNLDGTYWDDRYHAGDTPWDIGHVSTPLKAYVDQLSNKELRMLIPGCGNAYEGAYLFQQGFQQTFLIDVSPLALQNAEKRFQGIPADHLLLEDFFKHRGTYNRIIEQTFFSAIEPHLRLQYAQQCANLLAPGGKLVGLLFDDPLYSEHPPFGGSKEEYEMYFEPFFDIEVMETAHNSITPRAGRELFLILRKKS